MTLFHVLAVFRLVPDWIFNGHHGPKDLKCVSKHFSFEVHWVAMMRRLFPAFWFPADWFWSQMSFNGSRFFSGYGFEHISHGVASPCLIIKNRKVYSILHRFHFQWFLRVGTHFRLYPLWYLVAWSVCHEFDFHSVHRFGLRLQLYCFRLPISSTIC